MGFSAEWGEASAGEHEVPDTSPKPALCRERGWALLQVPHGHTSLNCDHPSSATLPSPTPSHSWSLTSAYTSNSEAADLCARGQGSQWPTAP